MGRAVYDSCKLSTTPGEQARHVDCFFGGLPWVFASLLSLSLHL